ncbi:MAG: hypothetical protein A4E57_04367 [Syntrophorhabdaceae bacterium PtaU1.Bin034]|nr:MAG: hypothetical protein A4E57_04367 [Syntrophorhabdaceae bacterium PtaU1.Bin034]
MLLCILPPPLLKPRARALSISCESRWSSLPAIAVAAKTVQTPVGSKPSYTETEFSREAISVPTARAARNSLPLHPPASSQAANAVGTEDEPTCIPGTIPSQKSRARAITLLTNAAL